MTFRADERHAVPPRAGEWVAREIPPRVAGWSDAQLITLAAIAMAVVPGDDAPHRASALATLIDATAPGPDAAAVRTLLDRLDGTGHGPFRGHRFVGEPEDAQAAMLVALSDAPDSSTRGAWERLRRGLLLEGWAGPAPATAERLRSIGYRPDTAVPALEPSPVVPLTVAAGSAPLDLDADVVIVGSGAGGGVVAHRLAEAGRSVLVVEAGRWVPEAALPRREGAALDLLHLDRGATQTSDGAVAVLAAATPGGGTSLGWTACSLPSRAVLAEWALHHGLEGADGPVTGSDLLRLRGELGFLRPIVTPPRDRALFAGAAALGWEAAPAARSADPCDACGSCAFGCPAGTKRGGIRGHLGWAAARGARLLAGATVDRVTLEGGAVTGVSGLVVAVDGTARPFRVRSVAVVVAAGALRTPGLLVRSGVRHPGLGTGLRLGPAALVMARMPGATAGPAWSGSLAGAWSGRFAAPGGAAVGHPGPAHGGFLIGTVPLHPGSLATVLPWRDRAGHEAAMRRATSLVPFRATFRDSGAGRLIAERDGPPRLEHGLDERDAATVARARIELSRLARAAGAEELLVPGEPSLRWSTGEGETAFRALIDGLVTAAPRGLLSVAPSGTAHAGADPGSAPCDPTGRVRRGTDGAIIRGLWVADASLAPTHPGPDAAVAVMVLAARVARAILAG
jgi:choline dehydrogenase-like flavoprotein